MNLASSPAIRVQMSAPVIPKTMKALITQADKTVAVKKVPVPTIDADEILVEVVAVAQNPVDFICKPSFALINL